MCNHTNHNNYRIFVQVAIVDRHACFTKQKTNKMYYDICIYFLTYVHTQKKKNENNTICHSTLIYFHNEKHAKKKYNRIRG